MSSDKNPPQKSKSQNKKQSSEKNPTGKIWHSGFNKDDQRQQIVQYAYQLGGLSLVTMMECENGNWDITIRGDGGYSVGICQIHTLYHHLPREYYTSWQTQVELCNQKWQNGTKFYGPGRNMNGQRCSDFVKKRFYFE